MIDYLLPAARPSPEVPSCRVGYMHAILLISKHTLTAVLLLPLLPPPN